jgi:hypothetical protein
LDMMNFIGLALQMGHNLKNTLHDYWSRLRNYTPRLTARTWHKTGFTSTAFLHFADNTKRSDQDEECDTLENKCRLWHIEAGLC